MREYFVLLIKTSRPITWIIVPLVFLLGFTAYGAELTTFSLIQIALLTFPYCIFLYGINDIYDFESDQINPRKQILFGIKLEQKYHPFVKKVSLFTGLLLLLSALITLNIWNILGMGVLLFFSYQYSAPPLRLKERPPLDSISSGIIYYYAPIIIGTSYSVPPFVLPLGVYIITACVMATHSLGTVMDYSADRKVGHRTFAAVYGKRPASLFTLLVFTLCYIFAGIQGTIIGYYILFCIILSSIITLYPSEKLTTLFFFFMGAGFVIVALVIIQVHSNLWR